MGINHKLLILRVKFAQISDNGSNFPMRWGVKKNIDDMNLFLNKMYDYISQMVPECQFIEVSESEVIASSSHRWGLSPFHYTDNFYKKILQAISEIGLNH